MALRKTQRVQTGRFDKRISFYALDKTPDGQGGSTVAEKKLFEAWGSLNPVSANRLLNIDRTVQNTTHIGRVRWRKDLKDYCYSKSEYNNQLRAGMNGRIFTINTVRVANEDQFIVEFTATEEAYDNRQN